jgi:hypothetical protein
MVPAFSNFAWQSTQFDCYESDGGDNNRQDNENKNVQQHKSPPIRSVNMINTSIPVFELKNLKSSPAGIMAG